MNVKSPVVRYGVFAGYALGTVVQGGGYAAFILLSIVRVFEAGKAPFRDRMVRTFTGLFILFLICSLFSKTPTLTNLFIENVKTFAWICIAYIFSSFRTVDLNRFLEFCRLFTVLGLVLLPSQLDRFQGFYSHPNHLAYVSSLLVAWTIVFDSNRVRKSTFIFLLLVGIFASKSSGGMLNALVAIGLGLLMSGRVSFKNLVVVSVVTAILVYVAFMLGLLGVLIEKLTSALDTDVLERAQAHAFGADGSFVWRITYWTAIYLDYSSEGLKASLFGLGPGTMVAGNYFYDYMIVDPHNDYLRVLVEHGWVGVIGFCWLLFKLSITTREAFLVTFLVILQMTVGNVIVHLPTVVIYIAIIQYSIKVRNGSGVRNKYEIRYSDRNAA